MTSRSVRLVARGDGEDGVPMFPGSGDTRSRTGADFPRRKFKVRYFERTPFSAATVHPSPRAECRHDGSGRGERWP